ncbi:hypothetical protein AGMMS50222_10630 [Endomicrobiia bacterium]|nr:hypothetical protein AGMMS50222_10630 [Endomicrobiia bacterium]
MDDATDDDDGDEELNELDNGEADEGAASSLTLFSSSILFFSASCFVSS